MFSLKHVGTTVLEHRDAIRSRVMCVLIRLSDLHTSALDITGGQQSSWASCISKRLDLR